MILGKRPQTKHRSFKQEKTQEEIFQKKRENMKNLKLKNRTLALTAFALSVSIFGGPLAQGDDAGVLTRAERKVERTWNSGMADSIDMNDLMLSSSDEVDGERAFEKMLSESKAECFAGLGTTQCDASAEGSFSTSVCKSHLSFKMSDGTVSQVEIQAHGQASAKGLAGVGIIVEMFVGIPTLGQGSLLLLPFMEYGAAKYSAKEATQKSEENLPIVFDRISKNIEKAGIKKCDGFSDHSKEVATTTHVDLIGTPFWSQPGHWFWQKDFGKDPRASESVSKSSTEIPVSSVANNVESEAKATAAN